jgi:hypothetical protein
MNAEDILKCGHLTVLNTIQDVPQDAWTTGGSSSPARRFSQGLGEGVETPILRKRLVVQAVTARVWLEDTVHLNQRVNSLLD